MSLIDATGFAVRIVAGAGGIYLLLCALLWALQEKLIFHPRPLATTPTHPDAHAVEVDRGDAVLRGWTVNESSKGPLIVYFGGNAEEVSIHIDEFARIDATTVLVNYRGYGQSDGKPSQRAFVRDAVAIVNWAKQRYPDRRLMLFGLSLGSGVAALASPEVTPNAVILISPYRSVEHIARSAYPIFPVRWMLRHPFPAESVADDLPRALVVASPTDRVIRFSESRAMVEKLGEKAEFHTFTVAHNEFLAHPPVWRLVDEFVAKTGNDAPAASA